MKIDMVLKEVHEHENDLILELLRLSERHKVDHEIHHVARDLADWSRNHVRRIADLGPHYRVDLDPDPEDESALAGKIREKTSEAVGRRSETGVLLLRDLRKTHLKAAEASVDWVLLGQAAQGVKDTELLNLTKECHPGTLRQMRWANAMLKQNGTQILVG